MDNLTDKDLEWLRRLVENWDRKLFKKYLWYRRKQIEETIWSLKLDWYKANGSTVLIRRREAFDEIYDFDGQQIEKYYTNGNKEIIYADKTIKYIYPDGSSKTVFPDGHEIKEE